MSDEIFLLEDKIRLEIMSVPEPFPNPAMSEPPRSDPIVQALGATLDFYMLASLLPDQLFEHKPVIFVVDEGEFLRDTTWESRVTLEELLDRPQYPAKINASFRISPSISANK